MYYATELDVYSEEVESLVSVIKYSVWSCYCETSQKFKRPQCVQEVNCTLPLKQKSNEIIEKETTEKWSSKPQKFNTKVVWIKHYLASKWLFVTKARIYWNHDVPTIKTISALLMKGCFELNLMANSWCLFYHHDKSIEMYCWLRTL